ncbi:MAG: hypothetical protein TR69_WS6001000775 [candidate division WS6 bacterium OLB20]|uniref:Uncharacterized protein n=1 Tax=candidate division WS6 bacterium OLB20 TaxID=1617426 RepID=A0A136LYR5_9BACT|nr:MAG: hypothetical protein TR69_WS6001000775 [candidate division WS6 bacterium OLB20]
MLEYNNNPGRVDNRHPDYDTVFAQWIDSFTQLPERDANPHYQAVHAAVGPTLHRWIDHLSRRFAAFPELQQNIEPEERMVLHEAVAETLTMLGVEAHQIPEFVILTYDEEIFGKKPGDAAMMIGGDRNNCSWIMQWEKLYKYCDDIAAARSSGGWHRYVLAVQQLLTSVGHEAMHVHDTYYNQHRIEGAYIANTPGNQYHGAYGEYEPQAFGMQYAWLKAAELADRFCPRQY